MTQETKQSKPKTTGIIRDKEGKFVKGISGNPEGRPEGAFSLLSILKAELQKCPEGQDKKTYADLIVKRMLKESIEKGDIQQIKLIWNYIEGMPKESHNITGELVIPIYAGESIKNLPKHDSDTEDIPVKE